MDSSSKCAGAVVTPKKEKTPHSNRSKLKKNPKCPENLDPNVSSPGLKFCDSPSIVKSGNSAKNLSRKKVDPDPVVSPSPKKKIRERKFVIANKKSQNEKVDCSVTPAACEKCKKANGKSKCLCVAYENLRASQEEFFKNPSEVDNEDEFDKVSEYDDRSENEGIKVKNESNGKKDELSLKRSRDRLLEEAREGAPETGSGRVMHLVKEFEKLQMMPTSGDSEQKEVKEGEDDKKLIKWALPGLQQPPKALETQVSSSPSICTSDLFLTSEILGLDSPRSSSLDSSQESISTKTSNCGRRSRRRSNESSGTQARRHLKQKQQKATSQKPFMLRTEERGRCKEEEFMKKLQEMIEEEEKLRIPIAQGLPWTTDEPECLVKPPVKENTKPVDLVLHSDTRAEERSEFNHQVAKKMDLIEQYRMERERQQKLAEEEEIKRLRKKQVPKAQPMPYFDRPLIPRRSVKHPTIPKEPKFHLHQCKKIKSYMSLDDLCTQLE
ncbi:hypothetical protein CDL12_11710 [Handroanthus impetiginosus]|uniref:TPX2 C-terminal domain-containing protein n=1 Tax=Handroanthus impetiginosus TaxID=429701 RepID=A0A2G9HDN6_9LAMI|nr:hypothetical protein CDL12_11710 [Handroanthus impetiginosus]